MQEGPAPLVLFIGRDRPRFRSAIHRLEQSGYRTIVADLAAVYWRHVIEDEPHAIVIDAAREQEQPRLWDLCHDLQCGTWFIILLVSRSSRRVRTQALAHGVNQVLVTPGYEPELLVFLKAQRERRNGAKPFERGARALVLNADERCIYRGGEPIYFTAREFELVGYLARQNGRIVSADELMANAWSCTGQRACRALLKNYIARIRRKLEPDPAFPRYLRTIRGLGYKLSLQDPYPVPAR